MLSELMQRVKEMFEPYTKQQFMVDSKPQDFKDLKRIEQLWSDIENRRLFSQAY